VRYRLTNADTDAAALAETHAFEPNDLLLPVFVTKWLYDSPKESIEGFFARLLNSFIAQ